MADASSNLFDSDDLNEYFYFERGDEVETDSSNDDVSEYEDSEEKEDVDIDNLRCFFAQGRCNN